MEVRKENQMPPFRYSHPPSVLIFNVVPLSEASYIKGTDSNWKLYIS